MQFVVGQGVAQHVDGDMLVAPGEFRHGEEDRGAEQTKLKRPARCKLIASKTRAIRTSGNMRPSVPKTGQTTCYLNRTCDVLATGRQTRP